MLEELGLGEAPTPGRGRRRRLQHLHDPREARHEVRRVHGRRGGAQARAPGHGHRGRRLLRGGAARAALRALPVRRRRVRARHDPASRRVARRRRLRRRARARGARQTSASSPRRCRCTASGRFQAWVQISMGCNSTCSYCIVPAVRGREVSRRPGDVLAEVTQLAAAGRARADAARPERQLVGPRPAARHPHRVRRAPPRLRRRRRDRAHPLHEPAPEGLPRARDRGDGRVRRRVRARAPAAAVGLDAHPQGDAPHLLARALPASSSTSCARRSPTSRSRPTSSSASPARPRTTSARRWRSSRRSASTARSRSSTRRAPAPTPRRCPTRFRTTSSATGSSASSSVVQRVAAERNAGARRPRRGGARRGPEPHRSVASLRGRTRRNTTVNFTGDAAPGELVDVLIERATSTTLGGVAGRRRGRLAATARAHASAARARPGRSAARG